MQLDIISWVWIKILKFHHSSESALSFYFYFFLQSHYIRNQILLFKYFEFLELGFIIYRWKRILCLFLYLIFKGKCVCLKTLGYNASLMKSIVLCRDQGWVRALPTYFSCENLFLHEPVINTVTWNVKDFHASSFF